MHKLVGPLIQLDQFKRGVNRIATRKPRKKLCARLQTDEKLATLAISKVAEAVHHLNILINSTKKGLEEEPSKPLKSLVQLEGLRNLIK